MDLYIDKLVWKNFYVVLDVLCEGEGAAERMVNMHSWGAESIDWADHTRNRDIDRFSEISSDHKGIVGLRGWLKKIERIFLTPKITSLDLNFGQSTDLIKMNPDPIYDGIIVDILVILCFLQPDFIFKGTIIPQQSDFIGIWVFQSN